MNVLELDGVGDAFLEELFNKVKQPASFYITNHDDGDVTTDYLIDCGMKEGKILENFVKQLNNLKKLTVEQVISFMSLDGMSIGGKLLKKSPRSYQGLIILLLGWKKSCVWMG